MSSNFCKGLFVVLSGPSGVGKSTIARMLIESVEDVYFSVSYTTRSMRPGEVDGKDYFFVSIDEFKRMIDRGDFLEWAKVHGNYYGTSKKVVERALSEGKIVLLDIDVQGGIQVKRKFSDSVLIFVIPPSIEVLRDRLIGRLTDSVSDIELRLEDAIYEMSQLGSYDYVVINDVLERAFEEVKSILNAERCRVSRVLPCMDRFVNDSAIVNAVKHGRDRGI